MENKPAEAVKHEDAELREYEKKSLVIRAAVSLGTLILSGAVGYLAGKINRER